MIPQKKKFPMNFFETFPECFSLSIVSRKKKTIKMIGPHSRLYLAVLLRGRAEYELIYITNEAVGRVDCYQLISGKSEKNNCFSKFSSNSLDFVG